MSLRDRPTGELVVLIFAVTLGVTLVAAAIGVVVVEATHPELDTTPALTALGQVLTVLVGASVGYLAGTRRTRPDRD